MVQQWFHLATGADGPARPALPRSDSDQSGISCLLAAPSSDPSSDFAQLGNRASGGVRYIDTQPCLPLCITLVHHGAAVQCSVPPGLHPHPPQAAIPVFAAAAAPVVNPCKANTW